MGLATGLRFGGWDATEAADEVLLVGPGVGDAMRFGSEVKNSASDNACSRRDDTLTQTRCSRSSAA